MAKVEAIKSLNDIRARCIIKDDGTWYWPGSVTRNVPCAQFKGKVYPVRRIIMYLVKGNPLKKGSGDKVWVETFDYRDVTPGRIRIGSHSEMVKHLHKMKPELRADRVKGGFARVEKAGRRFTAEQISEIRNSTLSEKDGGKIYGCSAALFGQIRRGQAYLGEARNSSVFSWRPAA